MDDRFDAELRAALALDDDELAYAAGLNLAAAWRAQPAAGSSVWGWLALLGLVAGYVAWRAAAPLAAPLAGAAVEVALGTLPIYQALARLAEVALAVLDLARQPALAFSPIPLALIALALLLWPRQLNTQRSAI